MNSIRRLQRAWWIPPSSARYTVDTGGIACRVATNGLGLAAPAIVNLPALSAEAHASSSLPPQDQVADANSAGEHREHDREGPAELRPGQHPLPPGVTLSNRRSRPGSRIGDQNFRY